MMIDKEDKCPGCGGDLAWNFGLEGGGDPGYYEFCGAFPDCGHFNKPSSNGKKSCCSNEYRVIKEQY